MVGDIHLREELGHVSIVCPLLMVKLDHEFVAFIRHEVEAVSAEDVRVLLWWY